MTKYHTYNPATRTLAPAPNAVRTAQGIVCNPNKPEHFVLVNAKRAEKNLPPYLPNVIDEPPQTDSAHYAVPTGYEQDGDAWRRLYEVREVQPPPPKAYDRYKVVTALKAEGVWRDVRAAMLAQDEDALDMLYTAEDISEDEPLLLAMIAMLKDEPYNWTDENVAAVLDAAAIGGGV